MKNLDRTITRRDFLRGAGCAAVAATMGIPTLQAQEAKPVRKTKVVLIRDEKIIDAKGRLDAEIVKAMLDRAVTELFGGEKPAAAWKKVVAANDIVGIKSNVWGPLPTPKAVEAAIKASVMAVGVPEKNIDISDRGVLGSKIFRKATALINVRPLRTHHWSGVGGLIKNYISFAPELWEYHDNSCADLGTLWRLPICRDKTRLNILLMLTPLFHGIGPHHFDSQFTWPYCGMLAGTDPVALDTIGIMILQAKRKDYFGRERPLKPAAHHVAFADIRHNLGISDPQRIKIVRLGWQKDILI